AEAKKRQKGPLTAAQACTLEAQQIRLLDAVKSMSAKITSIEASLSAQRDSTTEDDGARGPEARPMPVAPDECFDLNAILDKYAPPCQGKDLVPPSKNPDQHVHSKKRKRTDQSDVSDMQSTISRLPNSIESPLTNDSTSFSDPTYLDRCIDPWGEELGTTFVTSVPYEQMLAPRPNDSVEPSQLSAGFIRECPNPLQFTMGDANENPEMMLNSIEPEDDTMLSPSIEELYSQCQNMDVLMGMIDWDTSRALFARLLYGSGEPPRPAAF
ncbi:hypothetical protein KCU65_g10152, partial [Aureobasidium melanogenum]